VIPSRAVRRIAPALPLSLALALAAGGASAQRLDLRYEAPRECPTQRALQRQIDDARAASVRPDRALAATVSVTATAPRWRAVIATRGDGGGGERTLEARSCARLVQAVALVIALAIDAEAERPDAAPPTPATPPTPTTVLFVEDGELPPALRPRRRARDAAPAPSIHFGLAARAVVDARSLPAPAPGFGLGLWIGGRILRARLEGALYADRAAEGPRAGARALVSAWTAAALGCVAPHDLVELCAGVELTGMDARADGFRQNGVDRSLYLATPLRATLFVPIGSRFRVGIAPELVVPWTRTEYRVAGVGALHAVPAVVFRQGLAFEIVWP